MQCIVVEDTLDGTTEGCNGAPVNFIPRVQCATPTQGRLCSRAECGLRSPTIETQGERAESYTSSTGKLPYDVMENPLTKRRGRNTRERGDRES